MHEFKLQLIDALRDVLQHDLDVIASSQREIEEGATHEESRQENDKDTRAIESTYLARGLAQRVAELRQGLSKLRALRLRPAGAITSGMMGALVMVDDEAGVMQHYFIAPAGGGQKLLIQDTTVKVVTPKSPLGRALLRKEAGDEVLLQSPQGPRELEITAIS